LFCWLRPVSAPSFELVSESPLGPGGPYSIRSFKAAIIVSHSAL
jgi:hypothetical protein